MNRREKMMLLAVDIGASKVDVALAAVDGGLRDRRRIATPRTNDPEALFAGVVAATQPLAHTAAAVGIGCPGPFPVRGRAVSPFNMPAWDSFPLAARMEDALQLPVHLDNDANCFALAEWTWGAARGHDDAMCVVVSTGIGSGIISGGRLLTGSGGNAGEIGHFVVDRAGPVCSCGNAGCLEALASGTAIALRTGRPASDATEADIARCAADVARAAAGAATLLDLSIVVLGGSVALGFGSRFADAVAANIPQHMPRQRALPVRLAELGDEAPLLGAAALALTGS